MLGKIFGKSKTTSSTAEKNKKEKATLQKAMGVGFSTVKTGIKIATVSVSAVKTTASVIQTTASAVNTGIHITGKTLQAIHHVIQPKPQQYEALPYSHGMNTVEKVIDPSYQLILPPYYAAALRLLPAEAKQQYYNLKALPSEDPLRYAGGILMHPDLPTEVLIHTLSFLPAMNAQRAKNYIAILNEYHPEGLHVNLALEADNPEQSRSNMRNFS